MALLRYATKFAIWQPCLLPKTGGSFALHLLPLLLLGRGKVAVRPGAHLEVDDARLQEVACQVLQDDVALRGPEIIVSDLLCNPRTFCDLAIIAHPKLQTQDIMVILEY